MNWDSPKERLVPTWFLVFFLIISLGVIYLGFERIFSSVALSPVPAANQLNNNSDKTVNPVNTGVLPQLQGDNTAVNPLVPADNTVKNPPVVQNQNTNSANGNTPDSAAIDPKMLRAFLEQGGIPKKDLDTLDDATLLQLYSKTLQDMMATQNNK